MAVHAGRLNLLQNKFKVSSEESAFVISHIPEGCLQREAATSELGAAAAISSAEKLQIL